MPLSLHPRPMRLPDDVWLGVNFWSRAGGPLMWRSDDDAVWREELVAMSEHGLTTTRSFFFWPDFHPEPYRIAEDPCARFARFLDLHAELGMTTIPTFIVGHMSGENWDPAWRHGRDLYTDVWMVGRQAWFAGEMVRRFAAHPAIAGWLISNEMPLYGGGGGLMGPVEPVDEGAVRTWAELMVNAVRAAGATQPVSLGDGAWGKEVTGQDNGFRLSWTAELVDWLGPHSYHMSDDAFRQHLIPAFNAELCGRFDRPVVLEEFGVTSDFTSDEHAADYYRQVLHSTLAAGVTGWLAWNNTDFDLDHQAPYTHRPFELHFGITTADGTPKAQLRELQAFATTVRSLDLPRCRRADTATGIVISSYLDSDYPFWSEEESPALRDALLQSYIAARSADLAPALLHDDAGLPALPLLIAPSAKALSTPGCRALEVAARAGSTVFVSAASGETGNQRGWWWPGADDTFGVRLQARYGLVETLDSGTVRLTFEEEFGGIPAGTDLVVPVAGPPAARTILPVEAAEARVVARDEQGRPALLLRETGAGRIVLATLPIEFFAARTPQAGPGAAARLYRALANLAGIVPPASVDDEEVLADLLVRDDGTAVAIVLNGSADARTVELQLSADWQPAFDGPVLDLEPYGAAVVELVPDPSDTAVHHHHSMTRENQP